ncbi:hypothetical protein RA210_U170009 [Rubrivivax sp. A210]|nr:hypothetical protein RA210_U170009 [Rubrivivax sp. A210]
MTASIAPRPPLPPFPRETAAQKVRIACEWRHDAGNGFRSYGNENWEFDDHAGLSGLGL